MINRIKRYIEEQNMFAEGDYVVAGVSGGADSICLLCVLLEISQDIPVTIHVVHVNHGIRQEAGEDAEYVEEFCRRRQIPFTLVEEDVPAIATKNHISTEEAGREVRYDAFCRVLEENRGTHRGRIAIAHNRNDCCETFLFHLFRGSGLKGLMGIPAVRDDIVRPLLCVDRAEIERYLEEKGIHYCIDQTNLEDNYTRNRIRHHILQTACEEISGQATMHIQEACSKIADAYMLIEDMTGQGCRECFTEDEKGIHIAQVPFYVLHDTVKGYVVIEALARVSGSRKDLQTVHVDKVLDLFDRQVGRSVNLPYHVVAVREYEGIRLEKRKQQLISNEAEEFGVVHKDDLKSDAPFIIDTTEGCFELTILDASALDEKEIPSKLYTKWFDYDKIKGDIVIRNRRSGDYFTIDADNRKKSLKAYFIDEKVPREDRNQIYLVTEGQHCLWIVGRRISNWYKVSADTKYILQIRYLRRK